MRWALHSVRLLAAQERSLSALTLRERPALYLQLGASRSSTAASEHQRLLGSIRCSGSTVKKMQKQARKQLDEADSLAKEGEDVEENQRKGASADRLADIGAGFREQAAERMGKAVSISRESFLQQTRKAPSLEEGQETHAELRKLGEEGKVAVKNTRRKLMQELGRLERDGRISSDEQHSLKDVVQRMTDEHIADIDGLIEGKSEELTSP